MSSHSERLVEQICQAFGSELLEGYVNSVGFTLLTRISQPVIVTDPEGRRLVIQFQHTRFSPLRSSRVTEIYNRSLGNKEEDEMLSHEEVMERIFAQHEEWSPFDEVTDTRYIKDLTVGKWEKSFYFAVYDMSGVLGSQDEVEPFSIYDRQPFQEVLPLIHITFHIQPQFVFPTTRESIKDIFDGISISFPRLETEHQERERMALALHPLDKLDPEKTFRASPEQIFLIDNSRVRPLSYGIHASIPRETTMGFIFAYLRQLVYGKRFF